MGRAHQKYQNGLPLNRQAEDWKQLGVPLSRATLANWIIYCAENYLRHVYDYFHCQLRMRKYLMADETRVQVLNEPESDLILKRIPGCGSSAVEKMETSA